MSRPARLALALVALAAAACASPHATLRLSITAAPQVTGVQRLRVFAVVPGATQRFDYQATVAARDLHAAPYVLELDVASGLASGEASIVVLGDDASDVPVASRVLRVPLGTATTHDVVLAAIDAACDADHDGFKPCAAKAACCTALEADVAGDCDDSEPRLWPFAEAPACRTCDQTTACFAWEPDLTETVDVGEPGPEPAPEPTPDGLDAREPPPEAQDVAEPLPDAPDVAEPLADVAEPPTDIAEPPTDVAEPPADVAEPPADLAEPPADVPVDLPPDTTCECTTGACCDGCHFRSAETACALAVSTTTYCDGSGCGGNVREIVSDRHCPGDGSACTGDLVARPSTLKQDCPEYEACWEFAGASCNPSEPCANMVCPDGMVVVPAGSFWMGCNETLDDQCDAKEKPQHEVTTPDYCIDIFEIGKGDYDQCVLASACDAPGMNAPCVWGLDATDGHPINCVTWAQAKTYCEWAGRRLCSEAEWEKAARGGCEFTPDGCQASEQVYPWGNSCPAAWGHGCTGPTWTDGTASANCAESVCHDGYEYTAPVDAFASDPSPYALAGMAGNVMEWVADCTHGSYDPNGDGLVDAPIDGSAWTTACDSAGRIVRGGSWGSSLPAFLRASYRGVLTETTGPAGVGFRCCKSLAP